MFALCSSSSSLFLRGLRSDAGKCPVVDEAMFFLFVEGGFIRDGRGF